MSFPFALLLWFVLVLADPARPAKAQLDSQAARPVAVLVFSGYGEFKHDLEFLGKQSGSADTAASVERWLLQVTQGQALAAVDADRPWGAIVSVTEDSQFHGVSFIPVSDFSKLVATFSSIFGAPVDAGDSVYQFQSRNSTYFVAQKGNWAYWAQQKSALDALPNDPLAQLGKLHQEYDLAVRLNVQSIPPALRDPAAKFIKQWLQANLRQSKDEDAEKSNVSLASLAHSKLEQLAESTSDLDVVTAGLNIDRSKNCTDLDLEITALPESAAAKQFAAGAQNMKDSRFSGVLLPDAIFSLHLNSPLVGADGQQVKTLVKNLFAQALDQVADGEEADTEQKAKAAKLVGKLVEILGETNERDRRVNFGLVVSDAGSVDEFGDLINNAVEDAFPNRVHETIIGAGRITIVAGGRTANGAEFEKVAMQIAGIVAEVSGQDQPKLKIEKYEGRRFHAFSVMAPQTMRAQWPLRTWRNLLGNPLKFVLAFGDDTFYVAIGEKGTDAIKRVIDKSLVMPEQKLPSLTASLGLAPIWGLIASENRNRRAAQLAENLKTRGKDRITFTIEPIRDGVRYRLEGKDGFNMLLGGSIASLPLARPPRPRATPQSD